MLKRGKQEGKKTIRSTKEFQRKGEEEKEEDSGVGMG
jgi:hypothetical protein